MALNARLELRQGQGLVITPQLQQAIKLLQLSNLELEAYVEAELEKNPLLAREEAEPEPAPAEREDYDDAGMDFSDESSLAAAADMDVRHDDIHADASQDTSKDAVDAGCDPLPGELKVSLFSVRVPVTAMVPAGPLPAPMIAS